MTPRKELYLTIRDALKELETLELVDLYRGQFDNGKENYPDTWTGCLIRINRIRYESMVENKKEGLAEIDILFYFKDGWMDQHMNTTDPEGGLIEIDIIDLVEDKLEFLKGEKFKPLELVGEDNEDINEGGIMSCKLSYETMVYKSAKPSKEYQSQNINPKQQLDAVFN